MGWDMGWANTVVLIYSPAISQHLLSVSWHRTASNESETERERTEKNRCSMVHTQTYVRVCTERRASNKKCSRCTLCTNTNTIDICRTAAATTATILVRTLVWQLCRWGDKDWPQPLVLILSPCTNNTLERHTYGITLVVARSHSGAIYSDASGCTTPGTSP